MELPPTLPAEPPVRFAALAGGVTLMQASFTDHAFERHSHDCYAIGVTAHGSQSFRCKGQDHDSRAGEFVLFNPDEDHDGHAGTGGGFGYGICYIPEAFVRNCVDAGAGLSGPPYFARPHVRDRPLAAAFSQLTGTLLARSSEGLQAETLRTETLLLSLLSTLLARHGERPQAAMPPPRRVDLARLARVKDYIRANFRVDLTVAELAAVAGLSRAHLTRAFASAFHTPPHVYLNAVRIGHAQTLIRLGMPLAAVAADCGFADQSHFARRFKGCVGTSPAAWRAALAV